MWYAWRGWCGWWVSHSDALVFIASVVGVIMFDCQLSMWLMLLLFIDAFTGLHRE